MLDAVLGRAPEALSDHRAHRAAQELELEGAGHGRLAMQISGQRNQRILLTRGLLRLGETVAVALAVLELERIFGSDALADLADGLRVEESAQALACADAHVMAALGADVEIALQLGAIEHRIAGRAFDPQPLGHRARAPLSLDPRWHDLFEPGHRR